MVIAIARGGIIGKGDGLPWKAPEDMKHFRAVTLGHAVIMGRKTHESIGRPLPDRRNIVVSSQVGRTIAGCEVAPGLEQAIDLARATDEEPRVIGGAALYRAAFPLVTRIYLTEIERDVEGDVTFELDRSGFAETSRRRGEDPTLVFAVLERT